MSCPLRVKRPSRTQEVVRRRAGPTTTRCHIGPSTSGQFIPSQLDFTVRAARNRRGFFSRPKCASIRKKSRRARCTRRMRHGVSSANEYIDLRENRSPSDGPLSFLSSFKRPLTTRSLAFSRSPEANAIPVLLPPLRFESVIGERGIPPPPALTFPRLGQECDAGDRWPSAELFDAFLLVTLHFARFIGAHDRTP